MLALGQARVGLGQGMPSSQNNYVLSTEKYARSRTHGAVGGATVNKVDDQGPDDQ